MKILVISRSVFTNNPQSIRFRNFIHHWKKENDITVLTFFDNIPINQPLVQPGYSIIPVKISKFSRIIVKPIDPKIKETTKSSFSIYSQVIRFFKFIRYKKAFFPDIYVLTINALKQELKKVLEKNKYDVIIISAFPFSFQLLGKFIRKNADQNIKLIYDTGDPLAGNMSQTAHGAIHRFRSGSFEQKNLPFFDAIFVPNNYLKQHYIQTLAGKFPERAIHVIPQGINSITIKAKDSKGAVPLKLIYAGSFYKGLREPFPLYSAIQNNKKFILDVFGNISADYIIQTNNIFFRGAVDSSVVFNKYEDSDIIVFIDNDQGVQVPGKIYEILSAGRPILFIYNNDKSPSLEISSGYKFVFPAKNNPENILSALERIVVALPHLQYDFPSDYYTWENLSKEYLDKLRLA